MGLRCKRCGGEEHVKNGLMRGKQRYRCKACGLNFTDTPPRGMPLAMKVTAVLLYVSGLSMNRTAKLLGVSTPSVMAWIERFAEAYAQKPEPEGRAVVVELDEMWHFLKNVWPAPSARVMSDGVLVCINVSGLRVQALAKMDRARRGPHKEGGVEHHIFGQASATPARPLHHLSSTSADFVRDLGVRPTAVADQAGMPTCRQV